MEYADQTPAFLPLSLLEALQNLDTPQGNGTEEVAGELLGKRLGLSSTVGAELTRYAELARRNGKAATSQVTALFTLIARRADHRLVFADAGRRSARMIGRTVRWAAATVRAATVPRWRRRLGYRLVGQVIARYLGGQLQLDDKGPTVTFSEPLSMQATKDGRACAFYSAAIAELFRTLALEEVAVEHRRCRGLGATACEWIINESSEVLR